VKNGNKEIPSDLVGRRDRGGKKGGRPVRKNGKKSKDQKKKRFRDGTSEKPPERKLRELAEKGKRKRDPVTVEKKTGIQQAPRARQKKGAGERALSTKRKRPTIKRKNIGSACRRQEA